MKKLSFVVALALGVSSMFAQDFKQAAGNKTLEVGFGISGGPISISGIQVRSFKTETKAMRCGIFIGMTGETKISGQAVAATTTAAAVPELKSKKSSFEISLTPGMEMHMAGTDRLSPYMGGVLDIGYKMNSAKEDTMFKPTTASGALDPWSVAATTTKNKDGFLRIGAGLVFGTDYYFAKKFYIGAEAGFGISFKMMSTIKTTDAIAAVSPVLPTPDQNQGSSLNFGPTVNGKLRLGWTF